jgi:hypothetical protein
MMSDASAAAAAVFGLLAIIFVFVPGDYYPSMMGPAKRKLPKWWGRLWFIGFAVVMFFLSLHHFLSRK